MTETSIRTMVAGHLSRCGLPVYEGRQIPPGGVGPYLIYEMQTAPFGKEGSLTVQVWTREHFAACIRLMEEVQRLCPGGQELLCTPNGAVLLRFHRAETMTALGEGRMWGARLHFALVRYDREGGDRGC